MLTSFQHAPHALHDRATEVDENDVHALSGRLKEISDAHVRLAFAAAGIGRWNPAQFTLGRLWLPFGSAHSGARSVNAQDWCTRHQQRVWRNRNGQSSGHLPRPSDQSYATLVTRCLRRPERPRKTISWPEDRPVSVCLKLRLVRHRAPTSAECDPGRACGGVPALPIDDQRGRRLVRELALALMTYRS
jgi:hypothetical protein